MKHLKSVTEGRPALAMMGLGGMKSGMGGMWQWMNQDMWNWMVEFMSNYWRPSSS